MMDRDDDKRIEGWRLMASLEHLLEFYRRRATVDKQEKEPVADEIW